MAREKGLSISLSQPHISADFIRTAVHASPLVAHHPGLSANATQKTSPWFRMKQK